VCLVSWYQKVSPPCRPRVGQALAAHVAPGAIVVAGALASQLAHGASLAAGTVCAQR